MSTRYMNLLIELEGNTSCMCGDYDDDYDYDYYDDDDYNNDVDYCDYDDDCGDETVFC